MVKQGETLAPTLSRRNLLDVNSPKAAEQAAFEIMEQKLFRMKNRKMNQFWKGLRKEHEVMVVLNRKRRSVISTGSKKPQLKRSGSGGSSGSGHLSGFSVDLAAGLTNSSTRTDSPVGGQHKYDNDDSDSGKDRLVTDLGNNSSTDLSDENDREQQIMELSDRLGRDESEEFISTAHHATVVLCQLLSFLAIAVFFFEEEESLFRSARWSQFNNADRSEAFMILVENFAEGLFQVVLCGPFTFFLLRLFTQLDQAGSARELFETRVATDRAKLLHGISQENPVDLRRSIHEVEGLLRILGKGKIPGGKGKQDRMVVKYTLNLLRQQVSLTQSPLAFWKTRILAMKCSKLLQTLWLHPPLMLTHPIRLVRALFARRSSRV